MGMLRVINVCSMLGQQTYVCQNEGTSAPLSMRTLRIALFLCLLHATTATQHLWSSDPSAPPWAAGHSPRESLSPLRVIVTTRSTGTNAVHAACNHSESAAEHACAFLLAGTCRHVYSGSAMHGFAGSFTPAQLRQLHACAPDLMLRIENDAAVTVAASPAAAPLPTLSLPVSTPWHLDRIDQAQLPLDGVLHTSPKAGSGVHVYIIDSGVRGTHHEFNNSFGRVAQDADFTDAPFPNAAPSHDCDGHGTHVAATVGGVNVGIAPGAKLHSIRVLDCNGSGSISDVVAGIDYVASQAKLPAVAVLSLGVPAGDWSVALETAVTRLVAAGVFVTVAAGNGQSDACRIVPASVPQAFTVGASDLPLRLRTPGTVPSGVSDTLYSWTDSGSCLSLFAPGVDIISACGGGNRCGVVSDTSYAIASGTSMAAPHVAGAAAAYLGTHPSATPAQVKAALLASATRSTITGTMLPGTPNALLMYSWAGVVNSTQPVAAMSTSLH